MLTEHNNNNSITGSTASYDVICYQLPNILHLIDDTRHDQSNVFVPSFTCQLDGILHQLNVFLKQLYLRAIITSTLNHELQNGLSPPLVYY